jgi:hypothetical protein
MSGEMDGKGMEPWRRWCDVRTIKNVSLSTAGGSISYQLPKYASGREREGCVIKESAS